MICECGGDMRRLKPRDGKVEVWKCRRRDCGLVEEFPLWETKPVNQKPPKKKKGRVKLDLD